MKTETGRRKDDSVRRAFVLGVCFMLFAIQPTLGDAAVLTDTFSRTDIAVTPTVATFYDYTAATTTAWTDTTDFDAGTYTTTNSSEITDSVVLDRIGPSGVALPDGDIPWWDTDWVNRRCFQIDHTTPGASTVSEYPIRVPFPIDALIADGYLQADLGDLRAVGTDDSTGLPMWPDDTEPDVLWIQVDQIAADAASHVCVYYGYTPGGAISPANHTEDAVFTYTSAKDIYYTVGDVHTSPGAAINVVSYIDGNEVSLDGAPPVPLAAAGDLTTFAAVDADAGSVISVLGPIAATGVGDGTDSLVPISYAGTSFAAPISRDGQQFSFIAPFGDATVQLYDGVTLVNTFIVIAGTPYTHTVDDITDGSVAIIESDVPVLVTHRSATGGDAFPLYPATAGDFYTVRSTETLIGFGTDATSLGITASDGSVTATAGNRGDATSVAGGGAAGGTAADGLRLSADQPVGVLGLEDADGTEAFVVTPSTELSSQYWIATDSQYVAFACPTIESAAVPLTISAPGVADHPITCIGGPDVAWAVDTADLSVTTSGISISNDDGAPFFAYYDDLATDDQDGLLGPKQGRQYTWPEPVVTPGGDEGLFETAGSWESATFDVGAGNEIYGLVSLAGAVPAGTELRLQMATAASGTPTGFAGPDGTATSFFTIDALPAVADFSHDGDRFLRVRAEFATTDQTVTPRLDRISVDTALPELNRSLNAVPTTSLSTTIDPTITTSYLLRVKTTDPDLAGSEATAVYRGGVNLANLAGETIRLVNAALGIDSVQQSSTLATDAPVLFQADHPYSVVLDHSALASGTTTVTFAWQLDYQAGHSIFFETDFAVEVTAP
jgi:hypothetical protein